MSTNNVNSNFDSGYTYGGYNDINMEAILNNSNNMEATQPSLHNSLDTHIQLNNNN